MAVSCRASGQAARAHIFHCMDREQFPIDRCNIVTFGIRSLAKCKENNEHNGHIQELEADIQSLCRYYNIKSTAVSNSRNQVPGLHGAKAEAVRRHKG